MGRKRFTQEDIIGHLRTVEMESGKRVPTLAAVSCCMESRVCAEMPRVISFLVRPRHSGTTGRVVKVELVW